ncbi:alkaline phosphatase family protein [Pseudomonas qingdaonensis]|nr:alkaline phosphatase family protein [Pseudomonas qingdaonensis]
MNHNVILVILDGLNHQVAHHAMGHLHAYVEADRAALYRLECELPALSRPLYECILTGVPPIDSGIVHNNVTRLSTQRSIFHYARDAGLSTAAAAYHWVSELYNRSLSNRCVTATPMRRNCRSSMACSTTPTTTPTRTCSPTPSTYGASTHRISCWCIR